MNVDLLDEESRIIYDARINYIDDEDYSEFWQRIRKGNSKWHPMEEDIVNKIRTAYRNELEIILYGCGKDGYFTKESLDYLGIRVSYFCDSNAKEKEKYNIPVISPTDLIEKHFQALVIISTETYTDEIFRFLVENHFSREHIITPMWGKVLLVPGEQYFDFFVPSEREFFIDAGAYDGQTTIQFSKWCGDSYSGAILFEPFEETKALIEKNVSKLENIKVYYYAAWDRKEDLFLGGNQSRTTSISDSGRKISGISIDEVVENAEVTFIKMDVEGSECKALLGAKNTIVKFKPRLAICVYHKPNDVIEIPKLLSSFVPEYRFAFRHYTSCMSETVLYAWVER